VPAGYDAESEREWPTILFLHGGSIPEEDRLQAMIHTLTGLQAIVVAPICPQSPEGGLYTNWHWRMLGQLVREVSSTYRVDAKRRSVIGFSMGDQLPRSCPSTSRICFRSRS
jgi:predicted peptidase